MRLDKFLFVARLYDSRAKAASACEGGRVKLNGREARPSKEVVPGDIIAVTHKYRELRYRVLDIPKSRIPKSMMGFVVLLLNPEVLEKPELGAASFVHREKGKGRPTKKERRDEESFRNSL